MCDDRVKVHWGYYLRAATKCFSCVKDFTVFFGWTYRRCSLIFGKLMSHLNRPGIFRDFKAILCESNCCVCWTTKNTCTKCMYRQQNILWLLMNIFKFRFNSVVRPVDPLRCIYSCWAHQWIAQYTHLLPYLCTVIEAILLYTNLAIGPIPPGVEKTRGEKDPCSTSLMRWLCALLFVLLIALTEGNILVTLREGAEHPYVKNTLVPMVNISYCGQFFGDVAHRL